MLKNHKLSDGFLGDVFMDKVRVRVARSVTFLLLADGEVRLVSQGLKLSVIRLQEAWGCVLLIVK